MVDICKIIRNKFKFPNHMIKINQLIFFNKIKFKNWINLFLKINLITIFIKVTYKIKNLI